MTASFDGIVIGAGPAGLAAAIGLALGGWKIAVVERLAIPRAKVCGGFIGCENRDILERFGVWEALLAEGVPLRDIFLSAGDGACVHLRKDDTVYGIGISRSRFDEILARRAQELGVSIFSEVTHTIKDADGLRICAVRHVPTGEMMALKTPRFIHATGANPKTTKGRKSFGGYALFGNVTGMKGDVALYFSEGGHLGLNRFEGGLVNACYVAEESLFRRCQGNMEQIFEYFLRDHPALRAQFAEARRMKPFKGVSFGRAGRFCFQDGHAYLVGDGVGVINPVVGGGNTLALMSGVMLAEALLSSPPTPGVAPQVLRQYETRWRRAFARRIPQSWMLGYVSHRKLCARAVLKLFQWQKATLPRVFQAHHNPAGLQLGGMSV